MTMCLPVSLGDIAAHTCRGSVLIWMCVCTRCILLVLACTAMNLSVCNPVVRAETDGAQLYAELSPAPFCVPSIFLSLIKIPRISLDGRFAAAGCRKNAFALPPPACRTWASPLSLLSPDRKHGDEKGNTGIWTTLRPHHCILHCFMPYLQKT